MSGHVGTHEVICGVNETVTIGYGLHYPIRHGQIENWVSTDRFLAREHERSRAEMPHTDQK